MLKTFLLVVFSASILDQQQKQTIPFAGGRCMGEFDSRIFITTARDVYHLYPVPLEKQVSKFFLQYYQRFHYAVYHSLNCLYLCSSHISSTIFILRVSRYFVSMSVEL